jgi:pimeloyl-ACP methyl ester carboxylesterase
MRREAIDLYQWPASALADQIDERIAKAEGSDRTGAQRLRRYPRLAVAVDEHTIEVAGEQVFYRDAPGGGPTALYLHSVPTSSDDWVPFLELGGGIAVDLLGFGRSSKAGNLSYTLPAYVSFVEAFLDTVDVGDVIFVGHGWGAAIALAFAQRHRERVQGLVLIDAVPLLDGFQWPQIVRRWRMLGVGELLMGSANRWLLARTLRAGAVSAQAWSDARIAAVLEQFDQGTQRAILRLHRSIDPAGLAAAGADLEQLWMPALVLWGDGDPWLAPSFADAYGRRLSRSQVEHIAQAGHWPWLDQPSVVERVISFTNGVSA